MPIQNKSQQNELQQNQFQKNKPQQKVKEHAIIPQDGKDNQDDARMNVDYKKSIEFEKEHTHDAKRSVNDPDKKMHKQDKSSEKDKLNSKQEQTRIRKQAWQHFRI